MAGREDSNVGAVAEGVGGARLLGVNVLEQRTEFEYLARTERAAEGEGLEEWLRVSEWLFNFIVAARQR